MSYSFLGVVQPHPRTNSAFAPWAGQGKSGGNQGKSNMKLFKTSIMINTNHY